ncbi:hypothetical protein [Aromatoleum aromaticum]|uniref:hypothetical protein n=1 Tax=Aromatoleum aromaticum TaxID=551760 RepID=UPI0014597233|nr:hypothetical protein [Aromatoleum aromaticum]NMG55314.1 hypothetical protein [Aromatoleum aromaticum]
MRLEIEARYLSVEWLERGRTRRVEVSSDPLDIELGFDGVLRVETQIFHDFYPWLGLRLSGRLHQSTPVFVDALGQEHPLLAVDDGAGSAWWVQDDGWDAVQQRHLSELHRTMGRFEVRVDDHRLLIENLATGLGRAQLDEYLQDFKHDLIWLVMSSGTATTAGASTSFRDELRAALSDFASAVTRVGSRPARVLREISAETRRSRVRPNAASFRQHARDPASPRLVGRASEETADTAENRYLRHMVRVCDRLARSADQAAQQQAERFADRARFEDERSEVYEATRSRQVNPEMFDRQLAELTKKLDRLAAWSDIDPDEQNIDLQDYRIEITRRYGVRDDEFFYEKPEGRSAFDKEKGVHYNVVRFPKALCDLVVATQNFCKVYTLIGRPSITLKQNSKGKWYRHVAFSDVVAVKPDRQAIEAKLRTRTRLESQGWQHDLSRAERQEMQREARTAASRAETYRRLAGQARVAASQLASCQAALRQQDAHWHSLGVFPQSAFPMGMRYVLSPDYAEVLKAFSRVRGLAQRAGIGDESLDELNRISILHASAVYERWCLVKIIGMLIEDFGLEPTPGWQELVIRAVTGGPNSASLRFQRQDIGVSVTLEIQPLLENGRRPDFRLRFDAADSIDVGAIVMDAKFRTHWRRGELADLLTQLVDGKGYGGEKDRVFILQPQAYAISEPTSPLVWGRHCDYGQDAPTCHRTGSIQLAAGAQGVGAQDNLRRLIAMGLQAVFPMPPRPQDEGWTSTSCCIRCGTRHELGDIELRKTRRGRDYWSLGCSHCGMESVRTHCYDCDAILFKNGTDLTYHRTLADQITNVMCPSCDAYFDRDFYDG